MNAPAKFVAEVDAETLALIDGLSLERGTSDAQFAAEAIRRVAESEAHFQAVLQEGVDAADRGERVSHEEVMAELDTMIEKHRSR